MDSLQIIETLYEQYSEKGFISEEEVLYLFATNNVSLSSIDSLTEQLLMRGVIIKTDDAAADDDDEYDRSQTDFEALYEEVMKTDPSLKNYIDYVRLIQPPQHREWQMLIPQYKARNQYAWHRLFEMYLRSVVKIAYSFHQRFGLPLSDTIQDGNIGLLYSFDKYDITENGVFPSYYPMWVMQSITRNMSFSPNPLFYFPVYIKNKLYRLYDKVDTAGGIDEADLSSPALLKSVMDEMSCTNDDAKYYLGFFEPILSIEELNETLAYDFSDGGVQIEEIIDGADEIILYNTIKKLLSQLNPRESEVLAFRYGLIDDYERTLEEIGGMFGVTRERIRQIEAKAIQKLSHPSCLNKLKDFYNAPISEKTTSEGKKRERSKRKEL